MRREPDRALHRDEEEHGANRKEPGEEQIVTFRTWTSAGLAEESEDDEEERRHEPGEEYPQKSVEGAEPKDGDDRNQQYRGQRRKRDIPTVAQRFGTGKPVAALGTGAFADGVVAGPVIGPRWNGAEVEPSIEPRLGKVNVVIVGRGPREAVRGGRGVDSCAQHENREGQSPPLLRNRHDGRIPGSESKPKFAHLDGAKAAL